MGVLREQVRVRGQAEVWGDETAVPAPARRDMQAGRERDRRRNPSGGDGAAPEANFNASSNQEKVAPRLEVMWRRSRETSSTVLIVGPYMKLAPRAWQAISVMARWAKGTLTRPYPVPTTYWISSGFMPVPSSAQFVAFSALLGLSEPVRMLL